MVHHQRCGSSFDILGLHGPDCAFFRLRNCFFGNFPRFCEQKSPPRIRVFPPEAKGPRAGDENDGRPLGITPSSGHPGPGRRRARPFSSSRTMGIKKQEDQSCVHSNSSRQQFQERKAPRMTKKQTLQTPQTVKAFAASRALYAKTRPEITRRTGHLAR